MEKNKEDTPAAENSQNKAETEDKNDESESDGMDDDDIEVIDEDDYDAFMMGMDADDEGGEYEEDENEYEDFPGHQPDYILGGQSGKNKWIIIIINA